MHPKKKLTVETPYGTFTRSTNLHYQCITVWELIPDQPPEDDQPQRFASWHKTKANAAKTRYHKIAILLGVYDL